MGTPGVPFEHSPEVIEEAFKKCNGVVAKTAEYLNCGVSVLYKKMNEFPRLKVVLEEARTKYDNQVLDDAEKGIQDLLEEKDKSAIFYTLNMRGHDRQWIHPSIRASQLQDGVERIQQMLDDLLKLQKHNFSLQEEALTYRNALLAAGVQLPVIVDRSQSNDPVLT
jgi:regulatory Fis family protein